MTASTAKRCAQRLIGIRALLLAWIASVAIALHAQQPPDATPPPAPPAISIDETGVSVTGATKSGLVVVFGVARRALAYHERMEVRAEVLATRRRSIVSYQRRAIARKSV
jgi:hypothetical protein